MYDESVDMSAANIAATSKPIKPIGTTELRKSGIAYSEGSFCMSGESVAMAAGVSVASAAMPHRPGIIQRQTKKKLVRVKTCCPRSDESVDMSAANIAATSKPIKPIGTTELRKSGIAYSEGSFCMSGESVAMAAGVSVASAAMPHRPGIIQRQTKKKLVRVKTCCP